MNINFHNNKISKEDSQYTGLSIVLHDSVLRTAKNYYLKCFQKNVNKIPKYIIDDIEISSDSDRENSDEENSDRKKSNRKNSDTKKSDEGN